VSSFERICSFLEVKSGHVFEETGKGRLEEALLRRMKRLGYGTLSEYAAYLEGPGDPEEWQRILSEITVKESYLFRGLAQWTALASEALPALAPVIRKEKNELVAWSAACARGEEAATLAMVLAESVELAGCGWRIVATDVDRQALEAARRGFFRQRAVRNVPAHLAKKYLRASGGGFHLADDLQRRIEYRWLNLVDTPWPFSTGEVHIILLRNVLIYFGEGYRRRVTEEARRVLATGGWLFVGPTETLRGVAEGLQTINLGNCFAYRHAGDPVVPRQGLESPGGAGAAGERSPVVRREGPVAMRGGPQAAPLQAPVVEGIVRFLAEGEVGRAFEAARFLLESGGERAEVQALAGICHEKLGEIERAVERYRAALYLEPSLFQVHWLLGRCLEREGWPERAAREYRSVVELGNASAGIPLRYSEELHLPGKREAVELAMKALNRSSEAADGQ